MFCKQCGNEVSDSAKFCPGCGAEIKNEAISEATKTEQRSRKIIREFRGKKSTGVIVSGVLLIIIGFFVYSMKDAIVNPRTSWYMSESDHMMCVILGWFLICIGGLDIYGSILIKKSKVVIYENRIWVQTAKNLVKRTFELSINEIDQIYKEGKAMVLVSRGMTHQVVGIAETDEMIEILKLMKE